MHSNPPYLTITYTALDKLTIEETIDLIWSLKNQYEVHFDADLQAVVIK